MSLFWLQITFTVGFTALIRAETKLTANWWRKCSGYHVDTKSDLISSDQLNKNIQLMIVLLSVYKVFYCGYSVLHWGKWTTCTLYSAFISRIVWALYKASHSPTRLHSHTDCGGADTSGRFSVKTTTKVIVVSYSALKKCDKILACRSD